MKEKFRIVACIFGLLLLLGAAHSAFILGDYARACFDLMLSFLIYPDGWIRNTVGKNGSEQK
jgi:hypothetical protein